MIVLKYQKINSAKFISHIEMLRHIERIIRRAEIPVKFSQGFNPHAIVYFSAPTVLGIGSVAEYVCMDTEMDTNECLARYNSSVSDDLKAEACFKTDKNPNLQGKSFASDYVFPTPYEGIIIGEKFEVSYDKKGDSVTEDVRDKIIDCFEKDKKLCLRLKTGNVNLRADRVLPTLNAMFNREMALTDVVKVAQYLEIGNEIVDVDTYLAPKK